MRICPHVAAEVYYQRLLARLQQLEVGQLAAHEAGQADAWAFERHEAQQLLQHIEQHYLPLTT